MVIELSRDNTVSKEGYQVLILGLVLIVVGSISWNIIELVPVFQPEHGIYILETSHPYRSFSIMSIVTGVGVLLFYAWDRNKSKPTPKQFEEYYDVLE